MNMPQITDFQLAPDIPMAAKRSLDVEATRLKDAMKVWKSRDDTGFLVGDIVKIHPQMLSAFQASQMIYQEYAIILGVKYDAKSNQHSLRFNILLGHHNQHDQFTTALMDCRMLQLVERRGVSSDESI